MIAVSVYVKGGVVWVMGASADLPVYVKLEDADNDETTYYDCAGLEVYEIEVPEVITAIEQELKNLENEDA